MASVIKLKRSSTQSAVPTTSDLQTGEIAVNLFDRRLYVSNGVGVTAVGGESFKVTSQDAGSGAYLKLLGESSSTSNTVLLRSGTGITVGRDGNGSISFTSTLGGDIDSKMSVANTQALHTSITANLNSYIANTNPRIADLTTEDGNLWSAITATNTAIRALVTSNDNDISAIQTNVDQKLGATATVQISGDVAGSASFSGNSVNVAVTQQNNSVDLGTHTTGNYVATVSGTANEIEVSGSGSETAAVTIGLPNDVTVAGQLNVGENAVVTGNCEVGGTMTVSGDLVVSGSATYLSTSTVYTDDGMFKLSANNAGDATDTGIYAKYVVSGNSAIQYAGYFRDATTGEFNFYTGLDVEPTSTVDTTDTGYGLATVNLVIDGGTY